MLLTLSLIYGFGAVLNRLLYEKGIKNVHTLDRPVISVGNLSVGGTGKTPITIAIASYFKEVGIRAVVLSRGYRRKSKEITVCRKGMTVKECGDEPLLMVYKGVDVVVGKDRVKASKKAMEELNPDIFILDDGFQHHRIKKDLNILVLDGTRPFWEDHLLPVGNLREPESFCNYADCILITRIERLRERESFIEKVRALKKPFFFTSESIGRLYNSSGERIDLSDLRGASVYVMAGLGNNSQFFEKVKELSEVHNFKIVEFISFPDHYSYADFKPAPDKLYITTEKDLVKIENFNNVYALEYSIQIQKEFFRFLDLKGLSFSE